MQHIPDTDIDEALAEIPEADYRAALAEFLKVKERSTKAKNEYERYQKPVRAALNRGYEPDCVRAALQKLADSAEMEEWADDGSF